MMRTVIFGVDGLTFRVLHPLMERGMLPHFRKISQEGCEAILESKYPPLTPPGWVSLSTGLKPARHGVYDFWTYEEEAEVGKARAAHVLTHRKGGKAIWNILSEYGKQVLVVNVPMTYPPEPVNGIMVSGYTSPGAHVDFTYPSSFKDELYRVVPGYQIDLDIAYREKLNITGKVDLLADAVLHMTEERIKLITYMLREKPWDFCYLAFMGADRLQHPFWEEVSGLHPRTNAYFALLDELLGFILSQLEVGDSLFIVSDHGFCGHSSYFDINEYLYGKGLLFFQSEASQRHRKQVKQSVQLRRFVSQLGLRSPARKLKRSLKTLGLWKSSSFAPAGLSSPGLEDVDWERTLAFVPSLSGFPGGFADIFLHPSLREEQVADLCDDLKQQRNPASGKPLIDAIYTNEVYGTGPFALREPHLLLLPQEGVTFRVEPGNSYLWEELGKSFGSHHKDGVLYAYGTRFKRGFKAPNAEIYDLVPTVLRAMNLPFLYPFDGRVLDELFIEHQGPEQGDRGNAAMSKLVRLRGINT
ncbi:MAG TPA: alkaline phosphatase family protein [Ktedonobacteraceae bacterium]|nr:alkaline phosphatase family protein [Ktedonobacteraceae bacterium]